MARCVRSSSTSRTSSPARSASIVIRVSTPKPAATGNISARARAESARCPESGSCDVLPGAKLDERPRGALREPEPTADTPREARDRHVGTRLDERMEIAVEIGIAEEDRPGAALPLGERQRLSLASARQPDDPGARRLRRRRRPVARPVVRDHHVRVGKRVPQRRHRPADPLLLVAGCDEHRQPGSLTPWSRGEAADPEGCRRRHPTPVP